MKPARIFLLILIAALILVGPGRAGPPINPAHGPFRGDLAGHFMVAAPTLRDGQFAHTIVLIVNHQREGAFGLIINRPIKDVPTAQFLAAFELEPADGVPPTLRLYGGGPVGNGQVFVLHSNDFKSEHTIPVPGMEIGLTNDKSVLEAIARGEGPKRYRVVVNYSGWGGGQLEGEIDRNDWRLMAAEADYLFDDDPLGSWEEAWNAAGFTL